MTHAAHDNPTAGRRTTEDRIRSVRRSYAVNFGAEQVISRRGILSRAESYLIEMAKSPHRSGCDVSDGPETMQRCQIGNDLELEEGVGVCGKDWQSVPVGVGLLVADRRITVAGRRRYGVFSSPRARITQSRFRKPHRASATHATRETTRGTVRRLVRLLSSWLAQLAQARRSRTDTVPTSSQRRIRHPPATIAPRSTRCKLRFSADASPPASRHREGVQLSVSRRSAWQIAIGVACYCEGFAACPHVTPGLRARQFGQLSGAQPTPFPQFEVPRPAPWLSAAWAPGSRCFFFHAMAVTSV